MSTEAIIHRHSGVGTGLALAAVAALGLAAAPAIAVGDQFALSPDVGVVGSEQETTARPEDTLADIAREFRLGHHEIRLANPEVDFWLPGEGTRVRLPTRFVLPHGERNGIVLNVPEMRLYYFPGSANPQEVITYPVSIGRMDWSTPMGRTSVIAKTENPAWRPPESIRAEAAAAGDPLPAYIPPGPDNPLGAFAIRLGLPGYLIHGTNRPYGVGMRVTHGCVRLYPEDIERLFPLVSVGTRVEIVNQPVKVGWSNSTLYIEVHPPLEEDGISEARLRRLALDRIEAASSKREIRLIGRELLRALEEKRGVPVAISAEQEA